MPRIDVEILARAQFALTVMFHYLFPIVTIGLGWLLVAMEGAYLKTRDRVYERMARFWTHIFAVNFAMGVATGIVMEFEFGTNWAAYSRYVGDVFGSALAAEGIFAFFLESGFLAVMVFGWDRVSSRLHFFATCMVASGATFSAVWIVVANSWQQTPAGFAIVGTGLDAHAVMTDFWAMVFSPSSMERLIHVVLGALMMGSFFVMSVMAYYVLRGRDVALAKKCFTIALVFGFASSLAEFGSGDSQSRKVAYTQPAKLAAFEGLFKTSEGGTRLMVVGLPDVKSQTIRYGLAVPRLLSLLVFGDLNKPVKGLDAVPPADQPPVVIPFLSYHVMVGIGSLCIALTGLALFLRWRGTLFSQRWLLGIFVIFVLAPYLANELGWVAAEVGRQPWIVYGLLRTPEGLSEVVSAQQVLGSIVMFLVIYSLLFVIWVYVVNDRIQQGPEPAEGPSETPGSGGLLAAASSLTDRGEGHSLTATDGQEDPEETAGRDAD